ncbi:DUF748 domain-containing protein [Aequorivita marina]|uniref:DUF748 domain-containing protein n=1 Tax=Aequorivita marina TaxID=3073654 RepID=UPI0028761A84|nr:DUF748 domain-containing protein [Aequorivita sp. S2608]MDS1298486.1 DUF748 domain-containing protein [Aequorivita sp. S2608]
MNKHLRRIIYIVLGIGVILIVGSVSINIVLKNKLESFIKERLPENMVRSYEDISVDFFDGSLAITNPSLIIKNTENKIEHTFINVAKLNISHISYWDYLFHDKICIETISLNSPTIAYYKDRIIPKKDTVQKGLIEIYKAILIKNIELHNGKFVMYEKDKDSTMLFTDGLSVDLQGIRIDQKTVAQKIPLHYKSYSAKSDTVFVKTGPYENLTVESFSITDRKAVFNTIELKTKYSKRELSKVINKERDHYNLSLKTLSIDSIDFGFDRHRFFAKSKMVQLAAPSLEIYRDKLVRDDLSIKPLYSKSLRQLPFSLTVDSLKIKEGRIKYEERVKAENMGGSIDFKNLDANISNVSNTYKSPKKTHLDISASFMENTPISVNWSFDVQSPEDQFLFKAKVGRLDAKELNSFTRPNLKVELEGSTHKTYFTIDGNNEKSNTDLKINYSNFKVTLLQKDGRKKNKFLSAVANIFIPKNSEKKGRRYKDGHAEATRDKTKSIFNFLWISVKAALTNAMI